ncbi:MAG: peptide MFS transporter [Steroidobacteraceae bacterium]
MSTEAVLGPGSEPAHELWGHPRLLWMLLTVTVGLNFGFYGFRAYLVPYIAQSFYAGLGEAAAQSRADLLASGFLALMYATPIVGGYLADKLLGEGRALAISLWLDAVAILLMALPSLVGFEVGMALFALATGLGIPLTVLIGRNYAESDSRREGGYTLYYLAINVGAFIAPLICAALIGKRFGYRAGFVAAAAGMALGAAVFQWRYRGVRAIVPRVASGSGSKSALWVIIAIAVLTYPTALLLSHPEVLSVAMYAFMGLMVLYFIGSCVRRRDRVQTDRYLALLLLLLALVLFWTFSYQGVTSLNFFARDYVDAPFDYTLFQSANPLYILIFAVPLALLWPWLNRRGKDPSTPRKFGIGLTLVALSYGLMAAGIAFATRADGKVGWELLAGCYLLQTLGELALSPIGYSLVGLLAAPDESSLAMGGWFFGIALAYQLAGWIATLTTGAAGGAGAQSAIAAYGHVYGRLFVIGIAVSLVYLLAAPRVTRLMHGVR